MSLWLVYISIFKSHDISQSAESVLTIILNLIHLSKYNIWVLVGQLGRNWVNFHKFWLVEISCSQSDQINEIWIWLFNQNTPNYDYLFTKDIDSNFFQEQRKVHYITYDLKASEPKWINSDFISYGVTHLGVVEIIQNYTKIFFILKELLTSTL